MAKEYLTENLKALDAYTTITSRVDIQKRGADKEGGR